MLPLLLLISCAGTAQPDPPAEPPPSSSPESSNPESSNPESSNPDAHPDPAPDPEPGPEPDPESEPVFAPLPEGVSSDVPEVALVGYGFRLVMNPPFQAAQLGRDDTMIVAWWDVNADGAGQHGRVGLYNVTLVPGEGPGTGSFEPVPVDRNGEPHVVLRRGEGGPEVRLPSQVNGLGGLGTLTAGPADRAWSVEIEGGPTLSWPEAREMLHSWDPEDGGPARFQRMPVQPWGPWKTPPDVPSEP